MRFQDFLKILNCDWNVLASLVNCLLNFAICGARIVQNSCLFKIHSLINLYSRIDISEEYIGSLGDVC